MENTYAGEALELPKILQAVAARATLPDAKESALSLTPTADFDAAGAALDETDTAARLSERFGAPPFTGAVNPEAPLSSAAAGAVLDGARLLGIARTLRTARLVKGCYGGNDTGSLAPLFAALTPNRYLEDKLFFAVVSEEEINDAASPRLLDIRRKLRDAEAGIRETLERLTRSPAGQRALQDSIVTRRAGRYVIPVKADHRGEIPGLVHDSSASGATLFVEPMAVVERNNEISILRGEEKDEIFKILAELSGEAAQFADSIVASYRALVALDLIFAKAEYGLDLKAVRPELDGEGHLLLKNARHPLLPAKTVVPVTIELGGEYGVLVITGANTGGKTVALKTAGLLSEMAMCGLLIPAGEGSRVPVFGKILADIGDEQSVEDAFSTFSAHISHIVEILGEADENSLVLLDEPGSGTDPAEGAALAVAVLSSLARRGTRVIATTHYPELKEYALGTPGVKVACVEFDPETLRPTYRLLPGVPGSSNAFIIAEKLGVPGEIVADARAALRERDLRFEESAAKLQEIHREASREREEAAAALRSAKEAREKAEKALGAANAEREKTLSAAKQEAERLVSRVRGEAETLLSELRREKDAAKSPEDRFYAARLAARRGLSSLEDSADPVETPPPPAEPLKVAKGDTVSVAGLAGTATVLQGADSSGKVLVLAGNGKMRVDAGSLRPAKPPKRRRAAPATGTVTRPETARSAASEKDLRGMRADEALLELDAFLDGALRAGLTTVWIIHGKGTGALRSAVREHLKSHPAVTGFRPGAYGEGEDGVTVAELR